MQDEAHMLAGRLDSHLAGRMEQCILNGSAQYEAKPKPVQSPHSSLGAGRIKSFIFQAL
jgi:hypothetical protein